MYKSLKFFNFINKIKIVYLIFFLIWLKNYMKKNKIIFIIIKTRFHKKFYY